MNSNISRRNIIINSDGDWSTTYYNEDGKTHREDGPAVEFPNGNKLWFQNGELHRMKMDLQLMLRIIKNGG